jgi:hypothetical protein
MTVAMENTTELLLVKMMVLLAKEKPPSKDATVLSSLHR